MPEMKHELIEWGYTGQLAEEGGPCGAGVSRAVAICSCGAKHLMVTAEPAQGQSDVRFNDDDQAIRVRHEAHVHESGLLATWHSSGTHRTRSRPMRPGAARLS